MAARRAPEWRGRAQAQAPGQRHQHDDGRREAEAAAQPQRLERALVLGRKLPAHDERHIGGARAAGQENRRFEPARHVSAVRRARDDDDARDGRGHAGPFDQAGCLAQRDPQKRHEGRMARDDGGGDRDGPARERKVEKDRHRRGCQTVRRSIGKARAMGGYGDAVRQRPGREKHEARREDAEQHIGGAPGADGEARGEVGAAQAQRAQPAGQGRVHA